MKRIKYKIYTQKLSYLQTARSKTKCSNCKTSIYKHTIYILKRNLFTRNQKYCLLCAIKLGLIFMKRDIENVN